MAILDKDDEGWWRYAVEFARRGLWPMGEIETHGPHEPPGDRLWGKAIVVDQDRTAWSIGFLGPHGCLHYEDLRGLRICEEDSPDHTFPVLPGAEKESRAAHWLRYARKQLSAVTA